MFVGHSVCRARGGGVGTRHGGGGGGGTHGVPPMPPPACFTQTLSENSKLWWWWGGGGGGGWPRAYVVGGFSSSLRSQSACWSIPPPMCPPPPRGRWFPRGDYRQVTGRTPPWTKHLSAHIVQNSWPVTCCVILHRTDCNCGPPVGRISDTVDSGGGWCKICAGREGGPCRAQATSKPTPNPPPPCSRPLPRTH